MSKKTFCGLSMTEDNLIKIDKQAEKTIEEKYAETLNNKENHQQNRL